MKRLFLLLALLPALFAGCTPETLLNISSTPLEFDSQGGPITLNFVANKVWSVSPSSSWCKVSPGSGDGAETKSNVTITVTCDPNTDYDARSCTLTVICEEKMATVTVNQKAASGLIVSKDVFEISAEAQQVKVEIRSNVDYTAVSDADWAKITATKGLTTNTMVIDVEANASYDGRQATVTVKDASGKLTGTVTIKQAQKDLVDIEMEDITLSSEAQSVSFEVKSNVDFELNTASWPEWIKLVSTKGVSSHTVTLSVEENTTPDNRSVDVEVKQKGGSLSKHFTITQKGIEGLFIDKETVQVAACDMSKPGEWGSVRFDVAVKSSVPYEIVPEPGREQCIEHIYYTNSPGSWTAQIVVKPNDDFVERSFKLIFRATDDSGYQKTLAVTQAAPEFDLRLALQPGENIQTGQEASGRFEGVPTAILDYPFDWTVETKDNETVVRVEWVKENKELHVFGVADGQAKITFKFKGGHTYEYVVNVKESRFADPRFRHALVEMGVDANYNGIFEEEELLAVKELEFKDRDFQYMYEIVDFQNLESLNLDNLPNLTDHGHLQDLPNLYRFSVSKVPALNTVDVVNCKELRSLGCGYNNLHHIWVNGCTRLEWFNASGNPLEEMLMEDCESLKTLYLYNCGLGAISFTLPKEKEKLETLDLSNNNLTGVFYEDYVHLHNLDVRWNQFDHIELAPLKELTELLCDNNRITSLSLEYAPKLQSLWCEHNQLTTLDAVPCGELKELKCKENPLTDLYLIEGHTYSVLEYPSTTTVTYITVP